MKMRLLALVALLSLSAVLTACGNDNKATTATPSVAPTSAVVNTPMEANTPMAATTATGVMLSGTPSAMVPGETPSAGTTGTKRKIVVGSKGFPEAEILGQMYAFMLEDAGVPVERKMNLGTTDIAQPALLKGGDKDGIDLYPEYTSTGLNAVLKAEPIYDPQQVYDTVKKGYKEQFQLTWLDKSPMNDTQAMVTTKQVSEQKGIKSLADLCAKAGEVTVAAVAEFKDRSDALPLLQKTYGGCNFGDNIKVVDTNLRYKTLLSGGADVAQAFSTDGEIAGNGLVLLEDPKNYGLPYNVAPVVRDDVLQMYPEIATALNKLAPKITNEEISALNWEVSGKGMDAQDVAKAWLQKQGLIK
jgi:osmoprotectant transport system substrate-binding protein